MAYGNASAAHDTHPKGPCTLLDFVMTASKTVYAGSVMSAAVGTGTVDYFTDASVMVAVGIAADTKTSDATAGSTRIRAYVDGLHWMKTLDTVNVAGIGKITYVDTGANGTPQHIVAQAAAGTPPYGTALDAILGRVWGFDATRTEWLIALTTAVSPIYASAAVNVAA